MLAFSYTIILLYPRCSVLMLFRLHSFQTRCSRNATFGRSTRYGTVRCGCPFTVCRLLRRARGNNGVVHGGLTGSASSHSGSSITYSPHHHLLLLRLFAVLLLPRRQGMHALTTSTSEAVSVGVAICTSPNPERLAARRARAALNMMRILRHRPDRRSEIMGGWAYEDGESGQRAPGVTSCVDELSVNHFAR
jgi:hypothetical protein